MTSAQTPVRTGATHPPVPLSPLKQMLAAYPCRAQCWHTTCDDPTGVVPGNVISGEKNMAWMELFTTDIGLLSLFTIGFVIVMAAYIFYYVKNHMIDEQKPGASGSQIPHAH
ncbi:MAG TPA: DUF3149 domain-containing protein [Rhodocyclaceae bacterium]